MLMMRDESDLPRRSVRFTADDRPSEVIRQSTRHSGYIHEECSRARHSMVISGEMQRLEDHCRSNNLSFAALQRLPPEIAAAMLNFADECQTAAEANEINTQQKRDRAAKNRGQKEAIAESTLDLEHKRSCLTQRRKAKHETHCEMFRKEQSKRHQINKETLDDEREASKAEQQTKLEVKATQKFAAMSAIRSSDEAQMILETAIME